MQQALDWLPSVAIPVGVVVTGSIIRGNPGSSSDLDIVVLLNEPWRRRVQRLFNGTPAEVFFNSPEWLRHCIRDEAARGRPVMAHMLTTGVLVRDTDGRMANVIQTATEVLARGPCLSDEALLRGRYAAVCQLEDAMDFADANTPDAHQSRASAVAAITAHAYLQANRFLPRPKERLCACAY